MQKEPLFQKENRVRRTYRGGKLLDGFLGKDVCQVSFRPEDWISSFVEAKNKEGEPGEGISAVIVKGKEVPITQAVSAEDFGPGRQESGVLVKLLDSWERLSIQVHPTPELAERYFGARYGKTECWHILETEPGKDAAVYIGFQEGITRQKWKELFLAQDVEGMLGAMHRFSVKANDTILVRAGTPHAIGAGCLLLEIQEPTDYTLRMEKVTVAGERLSPLQIHCGIGEEGMLDCFIYEGISREEARKKYFLSPKVKECRNKGEYSSLVSYQDTPCFALEKISKGTFTIAADSFLTLVVTDKGSVEIKGRRFEVKRGDKLFVPWGCGKILIKDAEVIVCYPPERGRGVDSDEVKE